MAPVVLLVMILAMAGGSDAAWCVCKPDASSSAQQKAIDYACGAGADCNPIIQNGPCYNPNTVLAHCSYAANSYYQRKGQTAQACDFSGTATVTSSDPSPPGCTFPATPSAAAGTGNTPSNTPSNTPTSPGGSSFPPPGSSTTTPPGGGGGGGGGGGSTFNPNSPTGAGGSFGLGPSGAGGLDGNAAAASLFSNAIMGFSLVLPIAVLL